MSTLAEVGDSQAARYPKRSKPYELSAPIVLTAGEAEESAVQSSVHANWVGYTFVSEDGKR